MFYYSLKENGKIDLATQDKEFAQELGLNLETEKNIVTDWDGQLYFYDEVPPKPDWKVKEERIDELKKLLADADYWGQKYIDGEYTDEEWEQKKAQRKAWRVEIRELEAQIETVGENSDSDGG